jgi:urease accessory protein
MNMNKTLLECHELLSSDESYDDAVSLTYEQRRKSRLRVNLETYELAWFLPRGNVVHHGEVLLCDDGRKVRVDAALESVSEVDTDDLLLLSRLAYHLGNRHVSLQIGSGWLRYQADPVLDEMVRTLGGEPSRKEAPFDPEDGAYHSHEN